MKNPSLVLRKVEDLVFEDRPIPEIQDPYYVKLAIKKTGICGSDLHYHQHGNCGSFVVTSPMVMGHESAAEVVEVGSKVTTLKVGDKVACEPGIPSRHSYEYKSGNYNLCPEMAFAATPPYDGTLAKYYLLPEDFCYKLPDHVSLEEGALVEPLSVGTHATRLAQVTIGDKLVVFGAGPVGLLIAAVGKAFGASKVALIDIIDEKLEFALKNGYATHVYNSKGKSFDEIKDYILSQWDGERPTVAMDATGNQYCIANAIQLLAKKGRYVQVGMGAPTINNFPMAYLAENELTVKGVFRYSVDDYKISVELIASGKVVVKPLITHRFKFKDAIKAYKFAKEGKAIKIMIDGPEDSD
uniref:Xylitol dehydrogenase n=1 Tax=[Candida] sonorensis TaxID=51926 RepID=A0A0A8K9K5_9ASCO|nr:xylitol dehydrogenase [[Candida] sonorensis]